MILVTGGLGFIGSHTARALLDLGESCVLTRHVSSDIPSFLLEDLGQRAFIAPVDLTDRHAVLGLGDSYDISGIVHLGAGVSDPFGTMRASTNALANVLEAANEWRARRVCVASTLGVYGGATAPGGLWREDGVVPVAGSAHLIAAMKKSEEAFVEPVAREAGIDCVVMRLAGVYGPRYRGLRTVVSRMVHAAVRGEPLDLSGALFGSGPDDGYDLCYVKDCARGIALLQTTPALRHVTYNVGSGRGSANREVLTAVLDAVPGVEPAWPERSEQGDDDRAAVPALDLARIREDTGFEPTFDLAAGIADYVGWLQRGNAF